MDDCSILMDSTKHNQYEVIVIGLIKTVKILFLILMKQPLISHNNLVEIRPVYELTMTIVMLHDLLSMEKYLKLFHMLQHLL